MSKIRQGILNLSGKIVSENAKYVEEKMRECREEVAPRTTPPPRDLDRRIGVAKIHQILSGRREDGVTKISVEKEEESWKLLSYQRVLETLLVNYLNEKTGDEVFSVVEEYSSDEELQKRLEFLHSANYNYENVVNEMEEKEKGFAQGRYGGRKYERPVIWMGWFPKPLQKRVESEISSFGGLPKRLKEELKTFPKDFNKYTGFNFSDKKFKSRLTHEITHAYNHMESESKIPPIIDEAFARVTHRSMETEGDSLDFNVSSLSLGGYSFDPEELAWMTEITRQRAQYARSHSSKDFYIVDWLRESAVNISKQGIEDREEFLKFFLPKGYYSELSDIAKVVEGELAESLNGLDNIREWVFNGYYFDESFQRNLETDLKIEVFNPREILEKAIEDLWSLDKIQHNVRKINNDLEEKEEKIMAIIRDLEKIEEAVKNGNMKRENRKIKLQILKRIEKVEGSLEKSKEDFEKIKQRYKE